MKKITTILMLLMLVCMGATAQVYVTETGQNMLSLADMKAGVDAGDFYVSMQQHQTSTHNYINSQGKLQGSYNTDGTTAWKVEKKGSNYVLKSVATGKYISSLAGNNGTAAGFSDNIANALEFNPVQSTSTDGNVASGYATNQSIWWNIASNTTNRLNTSGSTNIFQNNGVGIWTCIFTYKVTLKYNIVYKCYMQGDTEPFETVTSTDVYADGEGVTITEQMLPAFPGKAVATFDNSVTINGANAEVNVTYTTSTYDYTLVVNGAPDGTTIKIKDETVSAGAVSFESEVAQNDVVVTFPEGATYSYNVTISGTTITVNCVQLWPVALGENTVINVGEKVSSVTAATAGSDNDHWYIVTQVRNGESVLFARGNNEKLRRGTTAQTAASFNNTIATTNAAYLVRFISTGENDLYKMQFGNGQFVDASLMPSAADITNAATYAFYNSNNGEGSYFGWNINSKAGQIVDNNGAGNDVAFWGSGAVSGTSGNNVWYVYETTIDVPQYFITYIVNDENGDELFRSPKLIASAGDVITTLPAEYQRAPFYTYNTVNVTIDGDNEAVFTATMKPESEWPVKYTEDATNPHYYNLNIRSQYLVFDETNEDKVKLQATSEPFNPNASWAFIGNPYDGFRVINQTHGASNVLTYTTVTTARPTTHNIQFQTGAEAEAKTWLIDTNPTGIVLRMKENQNIYFHHENGNVKYLRTCSLGEYQYVHNDAGSTIIATTDMEALVQLYNMLKDAPIGEGLNQYSATGVNPEEILANAGTVIDNEESSQYYDTYQALLNLQSALTLNMPKAGQFLRIKTAPVWAAEKFSGEQPYLIAENSTVENKTDRAAFSKTAGNDVSSIWCYVEDGGNKYLINYPTGRPVVNNSNFLGFGNDKYMATGATTITFQPATNGEVGAYGILFASNTRALYTNENLYTDAAGSTGSGAGYNFTLEEVTELPITLRSTDNVNYFATFSAPVNVRISDASLNTVTNNNKTAAYNTVDTDMLKAGVGVLLSGTSDKATATIITDEVAEADYGLVGYYAATAGTGDESMLYLGKGKTSGKAGFYKLGEGTSSNGFKAYLSTAAGAKEGLELEFAGVTGIDNMENGTLNMENGAVYNLQGQRVNKAQKGVFIQNGKKVVLK